MSAWVDGMRVHDRNLAAEIYDELTSEASVDEALEMWRFPFHEDPGDRRRMWLALRAATAVAIEAVLARRLREAARTGPWSETMSDGELLAYMGTDAAKWAAEFCRIARDHGHDLDEGWMIGWFANAIEQARAGPWEETVELVEPLTGDTKIVDKRTGRIVGTRRGDYDEEDGYPWVMLPRKRTP